MQKITGKESRDTMKQEALLEKIERISQKGIQLGLGTMQALMAELGNPQDRMPFVHVAGSNGKGTVSTLIARMLICQGYRVGHFHSPAVYRQDEMIQVGDRGMTMQEEEGYLRKIQDVLRRNPQIRPTTFEIETAMAFLFFAEQNCEIGVLEVGLGGALDATNVVQRTIGAVFTSISMDHMAYLGDTPPKIARQKAGILKGNHWVVSGPQLEEVMQVLKSETRRQNCSCTFVQSSHIRLEGNPVKEGHWQFSYPPLENADFSLWGLYQGENAAIAIESIMCLSASGFPVSEASVRKALASTCMPGRMDHFQDERGLCWLLDGAHNPGAALRLRQSLNALFPGQALLYVFGVFQDKDYRRIIQEMLPPGSTVILVPVPGERGKSPYELAEEIQNMQKPYHVRVAENISAGVQLAVQESPGWTVAFGSLSYLGSLKEEILHENGSK